MIDEWHEHTNRAADIPTLDCNELQSGTTKVGASDDFGFRSNLKAM